MALHRFTLFMTVPAVVVVATMCMWLVVLLWMVPSLADTPILPFGGTFPIPVAARFVASLDFSSVLVPSHQKVRDEKALKETWLGRDRGIAYHEESGDLSSFKITLGDLGDWPFPPLPPQHRLVAMDPRILLKDLLVFDLDDLKPSQKTMVQYSRLFRHSHCRGGYDREAFYINEGAHLHFQGEALRWGSIKVSSYDEEPICLISHLPDTFSFHCLIPRTTMYNVTYHNLRAVNVTISHFLFSAHNKPLCHGPCTLPLTWSWKPVYHRMVIVPHIVACVMDNGHECDARCLQAAFFQGSTHFTIDWRRITTVCMVLQFGLGGMLLMVLWPALYRLSSGDRLTSRTAHSDYRTFGEQDGPRGLPRLFEEAEASRCLAAFIMFGFMGLHRIYRISHDPQLSRSSKALDCLLVFLLGPLFFARDGLCFADFLYEDLIDLATVEELKNLEQHMASPDGVVVAEQPERNVAYAFFLSPLYWLLLIRVADLCNGNMMGDQVYLSLLGCGLVIFVLWMFSPSSFIIWSAPHGSLIIARQWLCSLQIWVAPLSLFSEARCRLEWSSDKILIHSHFLPASQFLQSHHVRLTALHDLLHCLPLVFQLLKTTYPPVDLLPPLVPPRIKQDTPLTSPMIMRPFSPTYYLPPFSPLRRPLMVIEFTYPPPPPLPLEIWLQVTSWVTIPSIPALLTTSRAFSAFALLEEFWAPHAEALAKGRRPMMLGMGARSRCFLYHAQRHPEREFSHPVVTTALLPYAGSTYIWRFASASGQELQQL